MNATDMTDKLCVKLTCSADCIKVESTIIETPNQLKKAPTIYSSALSARSCCQVDFHTARPCSHQFAGLLLCLLSSSLSMAAPVYHATEVEKDARGHEILAAILDNIPAIEVCYNYNLLVVMINANVISCDTHDTFYWLLCFVFAHRCAIWQEKTSLTTRQLCA